MIEIIALSLVLPILFLSGCATSPDKSKQPPSPASLKGQEEGKDPFSGLAERYRLKAREHEKKGDLPKALRAWEVVKNFLPGDAEAEEKKVHLKKQIPAAADQHFKKGQAFLKANSHGLARKEFLSALYLKPDHAEAIQYLKQRMAGEDFITYEVKKGDTIKGVARKIYEDPQKDFLIAYFNGLKADSPIEPPLLLRMPILSLPAAAKRPSAPAKPTPDPKAETALNIQETLEKGKEAYGRENYQESAALTETVLEYDPANREGRELLNASYYQLGRQFEQEKNYPEAIEAFQRVDSGYKDVRNHLALSQKELAEAHYLRGLNYFLEEKLEEAIQEWESTLTLEPQHPKAKNDIATARNLLQKLDKIK